MRMLKRFFSHVVPFWKTGVLALSFSAVSAGLGLVTPYLTKLIVDKAYGGRDLQLFVILVGVTGIVVALGGLSQGVNSYLTRYIKLRVNLQLNRIVFKKFQTLPFGFFQNSSTGENLYKISYDIEQVTQLTADFLPRLIILVPRSIFILAFILFLNPKMFLFVLILAPFLYIGPYRFMKILQRAWKAWVESSQDLFRRLEETLSHMYLIKASGRERREARSYVKRAIENVRLRLKSIKLDLGASFLSSAVQKAILGAILVYGGYEVIKGNMTLGTLSAISIYLGQLLGIQETAAYFVQQVPPGLVSCERLDRVLELPPAPSEEGAGGAEFRSGRLEFKDVSFGYLPERNILDGVSFSIEEGACVALTGPSGCGKTSIINLLLRLYRPLRGQICINGEDIQKMAARGFYDHLGVVLQEPYLWNDTLENNIRYGREDASSAEIEEAARVACIDGFIRGLPEKYRTVIGEEACRISEGQKQRVAIARAVIKKPKILVLDEAFSSLNGELEETIIGNLRKALAGSTIIVVSHRLPTIKLTDKVYFLESGNKIDSGTHDEVLRRNTKYSDYLACRQ